MTRKTKPVSIVSQGAVDEQESELIGNTPISVADTMVHRAPVRSGVASAVYDATSQINSALAELGKLRGLYAPGTPQYAQCETIDDRLHDALALLGQ